MEIIFRNATTEDLPQLVMMLANDEFGNNREDCSLTLNDIYIKAFGAMRITN